MKVIEITRFEGLPKSEIKVRTVHPDKPLSLNAWFKYIKKMNDKYKKP